MGATKSLQRFGQADKAYGQGAMLQYFAYFVLPTEFFHLSSHTPCPHKERENSLLSFLHWMAKRSFNWRTAKSIFRSNSSKKNDKSPLERMAIRGKLMEVNERLPRRVDISLCLYHGNFHDPGTASHIGSDFRFGDVLLYSYCKL